MRTRSADRPASPARPLMQARYPARSGSPDAIGGVNAEEPQDAQIVLGNAKIGIADEAHASCRDIRQAPDVIMHDAIGVDRQPVDGEIAPLGVARPVATERNLRLAAEGLDVLAQAW